ncbi:MAG: hypothetical protein QNJ38_20525 [Prochloraceae cyanobacterium]|nr:hypothetical protein [Prochloraceae cyanobacterium]
MDSLTRFTQISILLPAGKDVLKTVSFYEKLGFKLTRQEKEPPRMAVVQRDCVNTIQNYQFKILLGAPQCRGDLDGGASAKLSPP